MKKGMRHPVAVTIAYGVLALAMTWPLAAGLTRDVPSDLIDPLLNSWILAWTDRHATALLTGTSVLLRASGTRTSSTLSRWRWLTRSI